MTVTAAHRRMARLGRQVVTAIAISFVAVAWDLSPENLSSAKRFRNSTEIRNNVNGLRVGRTLTP